MCFIAVFIKYSVFPFHLKNVAISFPFHFSSGESTEEKSFSKELRKLCSSSTPFRVSKCPSCWVENNPSLEVLISLFLHLCEGAECLQFILLDIIDTLH